MEFLNLEGRACFVLSRVSTPGQAGTSIPGQTNTCRAFAVKRNMRVVEEKAKDVTGSLPAIRDDFDAVFKRKREQNDFDVLLVQDPTRFTRAGYEHGIAMMYLLRKEGIDVVFADGSVPDGKFGGIVGAAQFESGNDAAVKISYASTRGQDQAIRAGRITHSAKPIYGVDKLYSGMDGTPRHIIRYMFDGSQQMLDPVTKAVKTTFAGHKHNASYCKQKDEVVTYVPGDPERVEVVRRLFTMKLMEGLTTYAIAKRFNSEKIPPPNWFAKMWLPTTLDQLLDNTVFVGYGIANRTSRAIYHMRGENTPIALNRERSAMYNMKRATDEWRDKSQWVYQNHPHMADYLPPAVKAIAIEFQAPRLDSKGTLTPIQRRRWSMTHPQSAYFLKGILHSKQENHRMTGRLTGGAANKNTGNSRKKKRYYSVDFGFHAPRDNNILRRLLPADILETEILRAIGEVLRGTGDLRDMLLKAVREHSQKADKSVDIVKLKKDRAKTQSKLDFILELDDRELARKQWAEAATRITQLDTLIADAEGAAKADIADPEKHVDGLMAELHRIEGSLGNLPAAALNRVLKTLISRMEADLETKEVEVELALPLGVALDVEKLRECETPTRDFPRGLGTHGETALKMAFLTCSYSLGKPSCYTCRRRKAA
jgi:hypothetical protein